MALPARRRESRSESLWAIGGFGAITVAFVLVMETQFPHWTDPEYAARREHLLAATESNPDRPVLAVLGSSRTGTGFMPEEVAPIIDPDGREVLVFNFSHLGSGPKMNLLQLRRMLWDGVKPAWLVIEFFPGHLHNEAQPFSELAVRDADVWMPYSNQPRLAWQTFKLRLKALHQYRGAFLEAAAPEWATRREEVTLFPLGGDDKWERHVGWTPEALQALNNTIRLQYEERMGDLEINPRLDEAQRDLLQLCRELGIPVVLVIFPEDQRFRAWYGPGVEERIQEYIAGLKAEFGVPVIDTRDWMPADCFNDPHHLTTRGAKKYTARLEAEVLRPLVAGEMR